MDDLRVGLIIRAVRRRRGLRQVDVASAAGVSQTLVSLVERGGLEEMSLRSIRRIARAAGVRLPFDPRWRGGELAKLLDERHAELVRQVSLRLVAAGWQVTPERTFAIYGEKGSIDVTAWRPDCRAILIIEVKSELTDLQDLLATFDRKRRLAPVIAREMELKPLVIGAVMVFPEESGARKSIDQFGVLFDQAYPARALKIRRWLLQPDRDLKGLWFLPISNGVAGKRRRGGVRRVRVMATAAPDARPSTKAQVDGPDQDSPGARRAESSG